MIIEDVAIQDCHREAWLESQIKVAQRKIDRLCKQISSKEEIAQRLMSPWFCEHYDHQIGRRYEEMAQLEGAVRAAQLELDRLADKRYADKARPAGCPGKPGAPSRRPVKGRGAMSAASLPLTDHSSGAKSEAGSLNC